MQIESFNELHTPLVLASFINLVILMALIMDHI